MAIFDVYHSKVQVLLIDPTSLNARFSVKGSLTFSEGPNRVTSLLVTNDRVVVFLSHYLGHHDKERYPSIIWNYRSGRYLLGPIVRRAGGGAYRTQVSHNQVLGNVYCPKVSKVRLWDNILIEFRENEIEAWDIGSRQMKKVDSPLTLPHKHPYQFEEAFPSTIFSWDEGLPDSRHLHIQACSDWYLDPFPETHYVVLRNSFHGQRVLYYRSSLSRHPDGTLKVARQLVPTQPLPLSYRFFSAGRPPTRLGRLAYLGHQPLATENRESASLSFQTPLCLYSPSSGAFHGFTEVSHSERDNATKEDAILVTVLPVVIPAIELFTLLGFCPFTGRLVYSQTHRNVASSQISSNMLHVMELLT